jgi:hypothetical protein
MSRNVKLGIAVVGALLLFIAAVGSSSQPQRAVIIDNRPNGTEPTGAPSPAGGAVIHADDPTAETLDYSKPIYTIDHAMVCPSSLLFDNRADHDARTIVAAFYSLWNRTEKAHALGCEELQEGIRVFAHRGEYYKSLVFIGFTSEDEITTVFTLPSQLTNHR